MNLTIFLFAIFYGLLETAYFGWNMMPGSDAEVLADGITTLIAALAFVNWRRGSDV
jgi:hypothetical protein